MIKNILITGATSGIGFAASIQMIKKGHNLIITIRESSRKKYLVDSLLKEGILINQIRNQVITTA